MKIHLWELRQILRKIISEDYNSPTISSQLVPSEQEFKKKFPRWGSSGEQIKHKSPFAIKAKQVTAILTKMGLTSDAAKKKKIVHELIPYIEDLDPIEMFEMDPSDIATKFEKDVLNAKSS